MTYVRSFNTALLVVIDVSVAADRIVGTSSVIQRYVQYVCHWLFDITKHWLAFDIPKRLYFR